MDTFKPVYVGAAVAVAIMLLLFITGDRKENVMTNESPVAATEISTSTPITEADIYECHSDGKVCPDGSVVGRTGEKCEFAACPLPDADTASVLTTVGQKMTALNVSITPVKVLEDSRCPEDVQCIQAGRARISAKIESAEGSSTEEMEVGETIQFGSYAIKFDALNPTPKSSGSVPSSSYRFVFTVTKS